MSPLFQQEALPMPMVVSSGPNGLLPRGVLSMAGNGRVFVPECAAPPSAVHPGFALLKAAVVMLLLVVTLYS